MGDLVQRLRGVLRFEELPGELRVIGALEMEAADRIDALTAEVERLKGQDWQPIETAPTDGTLCLWWDDSFRAVRLGRFRDGYFFWGGLLEARSAIPREPKDTGFTRWCLPPRPPLAEPPH